MKKILIFLFINISIFALNIDSTKLDLKLKMGQKAKKSFTIINNKNYPLKYNSYIEKGDKNISINPSFFILPAHSEKIVEMTIFGEQKGEYKYFWVLEENRVNLSSNGNNMKLNMKYRIEHKYIVE